MSRPDRHASPQHSATGAQAATGKAELTATDPDDAKPSTARMANGKPCYVQSTLSTGKGRPLKPPTLVAPRPRKRRLWLCDNAGATILETTRGIYYQEGEYPPPPHDRLRRRSSLRCAAVPCMGREDRLCGLLRLSSWTASDPLDRGIPLTPVLHHWHRAECTKSTARCQ